MKSSIIILCLLGDPALPAVSCDRTGGFNVDMVEILKYWSSSSYFITVITNSSSYIEQEYEQLYKNIQIFRVALDDSILNDQPKLEQNFSKVLQETIDCIDKLQIRPIFFHSYYWYSGLLALHLSRKYKVDFLHSVVALSIDKKLSNSPNFCTVQYKFENAFLPCASFILAISNAEKRTLLEQYACRSEQIIVVGRSVDNAFLLPDHNRDGISNSLLQHNEKRWNLYLKNQIPNSWWYHGAFTYIGRIKYEKGVGIIIKAWYQLYLQYKNIMPPLWIVGGQPDTISPIRDDLIKLYPEFLELEKQMKICWWGYLTPASINAVLLKTIAVITHSQYEAGGRVIIEALSAGKPVIATPTGFADDLIEDWKNGFLVPFGNVTLLKQRMEHFIKQPLIANSLGEYAHCSFHKAADNWHYYEKHKAIYQYMYNQQQADFPIYKDENNISNLIPDFYSKKLLYSWPDPNEIQKKLIMWCKKIWNDTEIIIQYCPDLSHHSFVWHVKVQEKEYYIKYLYTIFNDDLVWNTFSPYPNIIPAIELYDFAIVESSITLDIKAENKNLCSYITEKVERPPLESFLKNNKCILQSIFQFDTTYPITKLSLKDPICTYEQMLESVCEDINTCSKFFKDIQTILRKEKPEEFSISYGKKFFSHILYTPDGYKLLPSTSVFIAPQGMDAAVFLTEIVSELDETLKPEYFCEILQNAAEIFHVSKFVLYNLCLVITLMKIKKHRCFQKAKNMHINFTFWKSIKKLLYLD